MSNLKLRLDKFLDEHFTHILLVLGLILFLKYRKAEEEKKDKELDEILMTGNSAKVAELEKTSTLKSTKNDKGGYTVSTSYGKETKEQTKSNASIMVENDKVIAARFATRLHAAVNPSGYGFLSGTDGTDEAGIIKVFKEIKLLKFPYSVVADAYKAAYGDTLRTVLENELSPEEFTRLLL
jgi:hypothetical protein